MFDCPQDFCKAVAVASASEAGGRGEKRAGGHASTQDRNRLHCILQVGLSLVFCS